MEIPLHAHSAHTSEGLKAFFKGMFTTFLGLLMALALENWHQNHRAEAQAKVQLQEIKRELTDNLERLRNLVEELKPILESYGKVEAYLAASPSVRHTLQKPHADGREFNFVWSTWDGAVSMGIQRHLRPEQNQQLGGAYAIFRRLQALQDASLPEYAHLRWAWEEDWTQLSTQEFRELKHLAQAFMQSNRRRAHFANEIIKEIEALLPKL